MCKKNKILISVLTLGVMIFGISISASAEDIQIGNFRNIVAGANSNIFTENLEVKKLQGWQNDRKGDWYYYEQDGTMKTGWFLDTDGHWYYFDKSGIMLHDTTVEGCYLGSNGIWIK